LEKWLQRLEDFLLDLRRGGMTVETPPGAAKLFSVIQFDGDIQNFVCIDKDGIWPSAADLADHQQKMVARVANFGLLRKTVLIGRYGAFSAAFLAEAHWWLLHHVLGLSLLPIAVPLVARFAAPPLARRAIRGMERRVAAKMKIANEEEEGNIKRRAFLKKGRPPPRAPKTFAP